MKAKELMNLLRSAVDQELYFTFVEYDIHDYLDGDETEVVCSCRSYFKGEYFLNETILNAEVVSIGIKSDNEIVFELAEDWREQKEEQITDVKIPSRIIEVEVTKNTSGLVDLRLNDIYESEMLDFIQHFCKYTIADVIFDKGGKWSIPLRTDRERMKEAKIMGNSEDYRAMAIAKRMLLFDYIENDKGFDAREKFLRIMCNMEVILGDMYEYSSGGMRTMRIDGDIYQIGVFDHEPVDKEHKLCSIQICYRRFNPVALISCGKRRMSLGIDDDDNLQASVIRWWPDRAGSFKYDREALAINELFSTLLAQYGVS